MRAGPRVNMIIVSTTHPLRRQQIFPVRKADAGRQHRAPSNEMAPPGLAEKPRTGRVPCAHFAVRNDRSFAAPESSHDHCPWLRRGSPSGRSVKHALAASGGILEHREPCRVAMPATLSSSTLRLPRQRRHRPRLWRPYDHDRRDVVDESEVQYRHDALVAKNLRRRAVRT